MYLDARSELLDRRSVLPCYERDLQTGSQHRKQPVREGEWGSDDLLHAGCNLRREAEIERDCVQAGLNYCLRNSATSRD
jgi:hypothetical protein